MEAQNSQQGDKIVLSPYEVTVIQSAYNQLHHETILKFSLRRKIPSNQDFSQNPTLFLFRTE